MDGGCGIVEREPMRRGITHTKALRQVLQKQACGWGEGGKDVIPCSPVRPAGEVVQSARRHEGRVVVFGFDRDACGAFDPFGPMHEAAATLEQVGRAGGKAFDKDYCGIEAGQRGWQRDRDRAVRVFRTRARGSFL